MRKPLPNRERPLSAQKFPKAPRWGQFAPRAERIAFSAALSRAARDCGGLFVRVVTTPRTYPTGAFCAVQFTDGTYQRAWFHAATPRSGRVYLVWGAFGPGPFERRRTTFWIGEPQASGILHPIPTWAWDENLSSNT